MRLLVGIKRQIKKTFRALGAEAEDAGKYMGHITTKTVGSIGHSVEYAVEHVADQTRTAIEHKVERTIGQVEDKLYAQIRKAAPGAMLLGIGITTATISILLLSIVVAQLLTDVLHLPAWAAYLTVSGILAVLSLILIQRGRKRLLADY
jgi:hypothetical protein